MSSTTASPPPPAPPLPPARPAESSEKSSIALKVREAPPGWAFHGSVGTRINDGLTPQSGTYFFYGTLQDPSILQEILELETPPQLRPAYTIGYELKLWGQYPAMIDGPCGKEVHGCAYEVLSDEAAAKLAYYETNNYRSERCRIRFKDETMPDGEPKNVVGWTFQYCGNENDLSDGDFDLDVWLRRMGRKKA